MRRKLFGILLWTAFCLAVASSRAEVFPPHQFRLLNLKGTVELHAEGQEPQLLEGRASPKLGDELVLKDGGGAELQVAGVGVLYLLEGSKLKIRKVEKSGLPVVEIVDGGVLAKTRDIGAKTPFKVAFNGNQATIEDGLIEFRYRADKKAAMVSIVRGKVGMKTAKTESELGTGTSVVLGSGSIRTKKSVDKAGIQTRWKYQGPTVFKPTVPELPDEVGPNLTILAPQEGSTATRAEIEVYGQVDDPEVDKVQIRAGGRTLTYINLVGGQFRGAVVLRAKNVALEFIAKDTAGNVGKATVNVLCADPAPPIVADGEVEEPNLVDRVLVVIKDPSKDPKFFGTLVTIVLVGLVVLIFAIRKGMGMMGSGAKTAAGLATGVIFSSCEKCGDREYEYHLFYTTEPVTSPFMRNLINNVNPMATSIMNESLENLLNTGLSGSGPAKGADQKIRVTCTWCDACKVGNLKLEHMQGDEVTKTDDYQIIHPIFIEWVRKVYD